MKILVTGSAGFVGKNLVEALKNLRDNKDRTRPSLSIDEIFEYDVDTDKALLSDFCRECDFVFNLAGVQAEGRRRVYEREFRLRFGAFENS